MKYYSEILKNVYDSEKECKQAEAAFLKEKAEKDEKEKALQENRKARAKEIEEAYKAKLEADKHYLKLRKDFIKDYGSFHLTVSSKDDVEDILETFFKIF